MAAPWEKFVDDLIAGGKKLAKGELTELVSSSKADANAFVHRQGEKLERYLNQLAAGEITRADFEVLVKDLKDLTELEALKMQVAAKASAQRLAAGIGDLVLNGLLKLI